MKTIQQLLPGYENSSKPESSRPETLTNEASERCNLPTCTVIPNAISSLASEDGPTPCASPDGQMTDLSGPEAALASRSVALANDEAPGTPGIYGRSGLDFSRNVATSTEFQKSLESKLRVRMAAFGSLEYVLAWKHWDVGSGAPICALRASARPTSDKGYSGWRSPDHNSRGGSYSDPAKALKRLESGHQINLEDQAVLAGWPTPTKGNADGSQMAKNASATGRRPDGSKATVSLNQVAQLAGWCTPTAQDGSRGDKPPRPQDTGVPLSQQAALAGWNTPRATDGSNGGPNQAGGALPADAALAGWATPMSKDARGNHSDCWAQVIKETGQTSTSSTAPTEKRGALNPEHSRWLMGYPDAWGSCGAMAMQSFRKLRRSSSKLISKQ